MITIQENENITNEERLRMTVLLFEQKIKQGDFVVDKTGCKMVEIINHSISLNPLQPSLDFGWKKTNENYVIDELDWYLSQSLSIKEISKKAKMWLKVCSRNKKINSNYGWCIFNKKNWNQYNNCLQELLSNRESRRACMIYNRPSMWVDYKKKGMNDFICTFNVQCFIRHNRLIYIVSMRSNDFIYGLFNDFAWHCWVYNKLFDDYRKQSVEKKLYYGDIIWNVNSLHVYERHFDLILKGGEIESKKSIS